MKLMDIVEELQLVPMGKVNGAKEVAGVYVTDLLSDVMANGKPGDLLVTVLVHENLIAVASLLELSGVLITGGKQPGVETVRRGEEHGIPLLLTGMSTFEAAGRLYDLLKDRE